MRFPDFDFPDIDFWSIAENKLCGQQKFEILNSFVPHDNLEHHIHAFLSLNTISRSKKKIDN